MEKSNIENLIIRKAELSDMPELLAIYNYEVMNGVSTFDLKPKSMEERLPWFYEHGTDNRPLLTAELDKKAVGYASLSQYRDKDAYHETVELSVYIDRNYRGRGIAGLLMSAILDIARRREDIHTVISVITAGNEASVKLHERFGFNFCGKMLEVGEKFGKKLDIVNYQLML